MATLSVLNYNLPSGLTMKLNNQNSANTGNSLSKTFNKITVQNVLSENNGSSLNITNANNPNAIVRKIKDFGMIGSVNNASGAVSLKINPRKRPLVENKLNLSINENKVTASATKKPKLTKEERAALRAAKKSTKENANTTTPIILNQPLALLHQTKIPGTPGRKGLPLPQAVARRNARERNRVKQVNNGFAALRERIPEEVAEVFENQGSKASGKKLSKVETLRMAVEYIRSLERLLGFDFPIGSGHHQYHTSSSGEESFSFIKDEFDAYSPSMDEQFDDSVSHYDTEEYFNSNNTTSNQQAQIPLPSPSSQPIIQMDMLPNITTLNGLQYIRIPGTNTYQLLTPDIFVGSASSPPSSTIDEEHFNALIDTNCVSPSSSASLSSPIQQGTTTTADLHAIPPPSSSINSIEVIQQRVQETTPVLSTVTVTATTLTNGENLKEGSSTLSSTSTSLLLSPVPQNQQQHQLLLTTSSPSASSSCSSSSRSASTKSPVLHQQQQATLSPALANDQRHHHQPQQQQQQPGLRQTCAGNQQHQQHQQQEQQEFLLPSRATLHMIKQEFEDPSIIYQQTSSSPSQFHHHHHQQQQLYHSAMSPPIDRHTPTTSSASSSSTVLQQFYSPEQSSFYEGVVNLKKEFNEVLLDASHNSNVLSDESMIEAIDWWDAHTPKSDGGSVIL